MTASKPMITMLFSAYDGNRRCDFMSISNHESDENCGRSTENPNREISNSLQENRAVDEQFSLHRFNRHYFHTVSNKF